MKSFGLTMKEFSMKICMLVAWLMVGLTMSACKDNDKGVVEEPELIEPGDIPDGIPGDAPGGPQEVSSINVTVGAQMSDAVVTRSEVTSNSDETSYNLAFTEGDRLSIFAHLASDDQLVITGIVTAEAVTNNGKNATFTGELNVCRMVDVEEDGSFGLEDASYAFTSKDPFSECSSFEAMLYPSDFQEPFDGLFYTESSCIASDINTLIQTALPIISYTYDSNIQSFIDFKAVTPVLNCNLDLLDPASVYSAQLIHADSEAAFKNGKYETYFTSIERVGPFAFAILDCYKFGVYDGVWQLFIYEYKDNVRSNVLYFYLGNKKFEPGKVYDLNEMVNIPIVTGDYRLLGPFYLIDHKADITVSGKFRDYSFKITNGGTVTLKGVDVKLSDKAASGNFISNEEGDLTIVLDGDNKIDCFDHPGSSAINNPMGNVYLAGNGTLSIVWKWNGRTDADIWAENFSGDPMRMAAPGSTVSFSRSSDTQRGIDYTTYKVTTP